MGEWITENGQEVFVEKCAKCGKWIHLEDDEFKTFGLISHYPTFPNDDMDVDYYCEGCFGEIRERAVLWRFIIERIHQKLDKQGISDPYAFFHQNPEACLKLFLEGEK